MREKKANVAKYQHLVKLKICLNKDQKVFHITSFKQLKTLESRGQLPTAENEKKRWKDQRLQKSEKRSARPWEN